VHRANLGIVQQKGVPPSLDKQEEVEFDIVQEGDNFFAVNVTGPGGMSLKGSQYARPSNIPTKVYRRKRDSSLKE